MVTAAWGIRKLSPRARLPRYARWLFLTPAAAAMVTAALSPVPSALILTAVAVVLTASAVVLATRLKAAVELLSRAALVGGGGVLLFERYDLSLFQADCCHVGNVCSFRVYPALLTVMLAGQRPRRWFSGDVPGAVLDCRFRGLRGRFRDDGRKSFTAGTGGARWRQG